MLSCSLFVHGHMHVASAMGSWLDNTSENPTADCHAAEHKEFLKALPEPLKWQEMLRDS